MKQPALVGLLAIACGLAAAQDHPAFTPPAGFKPTASGEQERAFESGVPNGDLLRLRVILQSGTNDPDAIAKGPALEEGDQIRDDTRQAIKSGALSGVSYSVLGKAETIEGVAYTRYRRVMGLKLETNPVAFAVRADILAKEPRPAQSTLESMARALTDWQERIGGAAKGPGPGPDPASKPALGGDQVVRLTGGGDLEIQVPAFWGRANLKYPDGHEEILLGPARDVVGKVTVESLAKDKDRLGPYISIVRIQKDTFKDLVDTQLLDIKESLLADYVARQADGGVALTLHADRDEGTLGTRTVLSVPFDEKRASGTTHRGRSVFMMHKGSLVIVTASHPVEKFDEGWPDIAKAFDTLLFVGTDEPDQGAATRRATDAPVSGQPSTEQPPAQPSPTPAPPPDPGRPAPVPAPGPGPEANGPEVPAPKLAPAPPDWIKEPAGALKAVEIPVATPISLSIPAGWSLVADQDGARPVQAFIAAANTERGGFDPLASSLRIEYFAFREELAVPGGLSRLAALLRLRLEHDPRAGSGGRGLSVVSSQEVSIAGRTAHAIQYVLKSGEKAASGTLAGTLIDGTAVVIDLRIAEADSGPLLPLSSEILGSIRITVKDELTRQGFGPYGMLVPQGWELSDNENAAGGRNIFVRSPTGVDLRFQTAPQTQLRQETMELETLRRVTIGFLVEGLKVLTLKDMAAARRLIPPGGGPGLRFESRTPQMSVLALAYQQGPHLVFVLRGAPPQYRGRDLAVAWAVIQSFGIAGVDRVQRADPVRIAGSAVARRVVFSRTELEALALDAGSYGGESGLTLVLLPDGTAAVTVTRHGRTEDVRGTYRVEGDQITIEGPGVGRMRWRMTAEGEVLQGEAPGEVLFRSRADEKP